MFSIFKNVLRIYSCVLIPKYKRSTKRLKHVSHSRHMFDTNENRSVLREKVAAPTEVQRKKINS